MGRCVDWGEVQRASKEKIVKYWHTEYFYPLLVAITLALVGKGYCATYYVDFDNGSNVNNGASVSTPWRSLPGTQNPLGGTSGWKVIQAGDIIYIKAGTTFSSLVGGYVLINNKWYGNGTSLNYISIQVSDTWGVGDVRMNGVGIPLPPWAGLVTIGARDYIEVKGTPQNTIIVNNCSARGFESYGTRDSHQVGIRVRYLKISGCSGDMAFNLSYSDNFEVRDCIMSDNRYLGFSVGGGSDQNCSGGKFYDCVAKNNGLAGTSGGSLHGFGLYGCTDMEYWRCTAYNNRRDGFDFGTTSNTNNVSVKLIDCTSYDNGEDGFALNGGPSGARTGYYVNCISYNNGGTGWNIYSGGVTGYIYHCLADGNNKNFVVYDEDATHDTVLYIKNSIALRPRGSYSLQIWSYRMGHTNGTKFYSDYNLWVQNGSESFAGINLYPAGSDSHFYNGTSKPTTWSRKGYLPDPNQADGNSGWGQNAAFVDQGNHDYHPTANSWTIGKGAYISSPVEAQTDRDGKLRPKHPTIGPYEYVGGLQAPKGLRIQKP